VYRFVIATKNHISSAKKSEPMMDGTRLKNGSMENDDG
jgi:hypothetical protein